MSTAVQPGPSPAHSHASPGAELIAALRDRPPFKIPTGLILKRTTLPAAGLLMGTAALLGMAHLSVDHGIAIMTLAAVLAAAAGLVVFAGMITWLALHFLRRYDLWLTREAIAAATGACRPLLPAEIAIQVHNLRLAPAPLAPQPLSFNTEVQWRRKAPASVPNGPTMVGESGAVRSVRKLLSPLGLHIQQLGELPHVITALEEVVKQAPATAEAEYEKRLEVARAEAEQLEQAAIAAVQVAQQKFNAQLRDTAATLPVLDEGGLKERVEVRLQTIQACRAVTQYHADYRHSVAAAAAESTAAAHAARQLEVSKELLIADVVQRAQNRLESAKEVATSPDYSGAVAEQEVYELLQRLPAEYTVFTDLNLTLPNYVRSGGENIRTAQIDFLVVGPSGVFDIEVKAWSQDFVDKGQYFDPYEQVRRSSYIVHRLLKSAGLPHKVRSVIATRGALPPKPDDSYAKVIKPRELNGLILYFKDGLTAEEVRRIVEYLMPAVAASG